MVCTSGAVDDHDKSDWRSYYNKDDNRGWGKVNIATHIPLLLETFGILVEAEWRGI